MMDLIRFFTFTFTYLQNAIDNITYVMALAREESPSNPLTGGWKLVEMAIRDRNGTW